MDKDKLTELELQNLFLQRNLLTQTITIIIGGSIGLVFATQSGIKIIFRMLGFLYSVVLLFNLSNYTRQITRIISAEKRSNCNDK